MLTNSRTCQCNLLQFLSLFYLLYKIRIHPQSYIGFSIYNILQNKHKTKFFFAKYLHPNFKNLDSSHLTKHHKGLKYPKEDTVSSRSIRPSKSAQYARFRHSIRYCITFWQHLPRSSRDGYFRTPGCILQDTLAWARTRWLKTYRTGTMVCEWAFGIH